MAKRSNLFLYPQEYKAFIDWLNEKIVVIPPRLWPQDEHGNWIMPDEERPPRDIVVDFARLWDPDDKAFPKRLASFVSLYGLLQITGLPDEPFESPRYGKSYEENISWWIHYAGEVHRLLLLYKAIREAREGSFDAIGEVLEFRPYCISSATGEIKPGGAVVWTAQETETADTESCWIDTGEKTGFWFKFDPKRPGKLSASDLIEEASRVLVGSISRALSGGVFLGKSVLKPDKRTPIGFSFNEQRYTYSPLAAVFYALWELIRGDEPVEVCAYSKCNDIFTPKRSTGKFCSPTCRVYHNRERKNRFNSAPQ